eukprot:CAMPEP_0176142976 /NCGR_PEP_ID=MMETSP0120_2-20121206/72759_1 /TAXON_ID=160619 /ORGANISM="Kryptoperidinium foliaceum, Strain CCMP 1326" /LENGTH=57 /DNA_ID=CAMNT_0017479251 /DNA_START=62 /DNA_END=233 /DNA_ORIENTATION=+
MEQIEIGDGLGLARLVRSQQVGELRFPDSVLGKARPVVSPQLFSFMLGVQSTAYTMN